jgi:hypothetical protein
MRNSIRLSFGRSVLRRSIARWIATPARTEFTRTRKFGDDAVAAGSEDSAFLLRNEVGDRGAIGAKRAKCCLLILRHKSAKAGDVGGENCCEPSVGGRRFHEYGPRGSNSLSVGPV